MSPSQKPKFPPNYAHSHGNPKPDITVDVVHITTSDTNSESEYDRKVKLFFQNRKSPPPLITNMQVLFVDIAWICLGYALDIQSLFIMFKGTSETHQDSMDNIQIRHAYMKQFS